MARPPILPHGSRKWKTAIAYIKAHRKVADRFRHALAVIRGVVSPDPWALLRLLGIQNFFPIRHQKNDRHPITLKTPLDGQRDFDPMEGYVVSGTPPKQPRYIPGSWLRYPVKRLFHHSGEPLGPEDYELGKTVEDGPFDPTEIEALSDLFTDRK